jgi:hypothetical protein
MTTTMRTITLTNDFHGTSARVRVEGSTLTHRQALRARRKLCGIPTCTCGGYAGERGGRYYLDAIHDGLPYVGHRRYHLVDRDEEARIDAEWREHYWKEVEAGEVEAGL